MLKAGRYSFSLSGQLIIGEASKLTLTGSINPEMVSKLYPDKLTSSTPCKGFVDFTDVIFCGFRTLVGGKEDGYVFSSIHEETHNSEPILLALPSLAPQDVVEIGVEYSGYCPPGYKLGDKFLFTVTISGKGEQELPALI